MKFRFCYGILTRNECCTIYSVLSENGLNLGLSELREIEQD